MTKYEELDRAIVTAIERGQRQFYIINADTVVQETVKPHLSGGVRRFDFRIVDARLQALKRKGLIEYRGREWHAVSNAAHGSASEEK